MLKLQNPHFDIEIPLLDDDMIEIHDISQPLPTRASSRVVDALAISIELNLQYSNVPKDITNTYLVPISKLKEEMKIYEINDQFGWLKSTNFIRLDVVKFYCGKFGNSKDCHLKGYIIHSCLLFLLKKTHVFINVHMRN